MYDHRKVLRKKRLLTRRERDKKKWRAANNIQNTSLVNSPGTEQWPVQTGDTCPGWGTAGDPLSHEMTAEGDGPEETQTCEQCQSQFFVSEYRMCPFDNSCGKCTDCCLEDQEDNLEKWRAFHHSNYEGEEEEEGEDEPYEWSERLPCRHPYPPHPKFYD